MSGAPCAIVDIGSNSVRLVAYERLGRALTPLFNEKVLCGLGRGVATTGLLAKDAMEKALGALRCFRVLCRNIGVDNVIVLATAATRDARNGADFLTLARDAIGTDISLIGGLREAELSAKGVISGLHRPDGVVGDLGGGSLELIDIRGTRIGSGVSLPIGGLALSDLSSNSPKRAVKIVRDAVADAVPLKSLRGRTFYAVGGTWRALAKLHMSHRNYPLEIMHGYVISGDNPDIFTGLIERTGSESPPALASVSSARRPLLAFGAVVLEEVIRQGRPKDVMISTLGVREGMLYERLTVQEREADPLLDAAAQMNVLRSRDPRHGDDLCAWTDVLLGTAQVEETPDEKRLRHAACLLSDLAWRALPEHRSHQAATAMADAALVGIDHPGRAFLSLALSYRYEGADTNVNPQVRALLTASGLDRARLLGAAMRVAFQLSAASGGVLPRTSLRCDRTRAVLTVPPDLADLATVRLQNRLKQLGRLLERDVEVVVAA